LALLSVPIVKIYENLKIQDGGVHHLVKIEKSPYLGSGLTEFDKIWCTLTQFGHIERSGVKISKI